jgi:glycosyltransferase involved in cell wall biosynthesis
MHYVQYLLEGMKRDVRNCRVTLLTSRGAAANPSYQTVLSRFPDFVTPRIAPDVDGGHRLYRAIGPYYEYLWRHAKSFSLGLDEIGPDSVDLILLPYMETIGLLHLSLHRGLFRGRPWITIAHHVGFHHRARGTGGAPEPTDVLQRILFSRMLHDRRLICVGTHDPILPDAVHDPKVVFCPHPAVGPKLSGVAEARAAYGIRPDTCVILMFGVVNRVKMLDLLLESAARLVPEVDLTVLLAGVQTADDVAAALSSPSADKLREHGRLIEVNRYIVEDVDIDPMSASDIVWAFYRKEFRWHSGVACRAALAKLPVIIRRETLTGQLVDVNEAGLALTSDDPGDIANALAQLAKDPALRTQLGENGHRTFSEYTPERLARPIIEAINHAFAADVN